MFTFLLLISFCLFYLFIYFIIVRIIDSWYETDSNKCRFENPGENSDHMQISCGLFLRKNERVLMMQRFYVRVFG